MKRFIESEARTQVTLLPECLDYYVTEDNPVRVVDVFVDELDLGALGFESVDPAATGRQAYHPAILLKIYIYGYLNRIQSSRRLEREAERNVELMWLTGRLAPDFKTIADFRKDNGKAIRSVCRQFVVLCRNLNLFSQSIIAIDGSKFKAVNNRDRSFTQGKVKARMQQIEQHHAACFPAGQCRDFAAGQTAELPFQQNRPKADIALLTDSQRCRDEVQIPPSFCPGPEQEILLVPSESALACTCNRPFFRGAKVSYSTASDDAGPRQGQASGVAHLACSIGKERQAASPYPLETLLTNRSTSTRQEPR
jgi:transposase